MSRKGRSITLSVSDEEKFQLETLAQDLGILWGDKPNVSELIKRIARNQLRVAANDDWPSVRINALNRARNLLIDAGLIDDALAIAQLLMERGELSDLPLRKDIEAFVTTPAPPWRIAINRYIEAEQPFKLSYQDAAGRILDFSIYYAEIQKHDERYYIDCWCKETEGNKDILGLTHNWSLRLDRIYDETAIAPIQGQWCSLESITVEFHLLDGLAFGYRSKTSADLINEWHPELEKVRRVIRKVTHTFWFLREIRRYGADCMIVSPPELRDRLIAEQIQHLKRYELPDLRIC